MLLATIKDLVVKFKALLVGFCLHAGGENAGPVDGSTEGLETHLSEERDILFVMMVEVNGLVAGVELIGQSGGRYPARAGMGAVGTHIWDTGAFAIHIPCALKLVGRTGATPQKVIAKITHSFYSYLNLLWFRRGSVQKTASVRRSYWHHCRSGSAPAPAPAWGTPGSVQTGHPAPSGWQAAEHPLPQP